jgi:hypothetical protein
VTIPSRQVPSVKYGTSGACNGSVTLAKGDRCINSDELQEYVTYTNDGSLCGILLSCPSWGPKQPAYSCSAECQKRGYSGGSCVAESKYFLCNSASALVLARCVCTGMASYGGT